MLDFLSFLFGLAEPKVLPNLNLIAANPAPVLATRNVEPVVQAQAALALDLASGKILYEKNAHERRSVGSLAKLMTALVVQKNFSLAEIVTVSETAASQPAAKIWLRPGEQVTVAELLSGLLIESGNDVAVALAEHFSSGLPGFVAAMNGKARALGLRNTHFTNPVGYDDPKNFSTAYDLSLLARAVLRDNFLREIVATPYKVITSADKRIIHPLKSTNRLFDSYLEIRGLKTGSTELAGECLAALAEKDGHELLAIVLNSPHRFQEGKVLLEWAENNFRW